MPVPVTIYGFVVAFLPRHLIRGHVLLVLGVLRLMNVSAIFLRDGASTVGCNPPNTRALWATPTTTTTGRTDLRIPFEQQLHYHVYHLIGDPRFRKKGLWVICTVGFSSIKITVS